MDCILDNVYLLNFLGVKMVSWLSRKIPLFLGDAY